MNMLSFADRAKALENEFFRNVDQQLWDKLRQEVAEDKAKSALREASGIDDEELLAELVHVGVSPETLSAVAIIPLVAVAWADGKVDELEKQRVLQGEQDLGISRFSPSHQLLEQWLSQKPSEDLLPVWDHYVSVLRNKLSDSNTKLLDTGLLERCRSVAEAAGGYFTCGSISPSEQRVLKQIKRTLKTVRV